jgi:hypothetical protein
LDERTALEAPEIAAGFRGDEAKPTPAGSDGGESVDFASRQAERGKMQVWLTAFTAAAALAVLAVVSMSVLHAG